MDAPLPGFWIFVGLIGALVGALLPIEDDDDDKLFGFLPRRIFNAAAGALLISFLAFVSMGQDPSRV